MTEEDALEEGFAWGPKPWEDTATDETATINKTPHELSLLHILTPCYQNANLFACCQAEFTQPIAVSWLVSSGCCAPADKPPVAADDESVPSNTPMVREMNASYHGKGHKWLGQI